MKTYSNIIIIYNPKSTGDSKDAAIQLEKKLKARLRHTPIRLVPTKHAGHARELAYSHAKKQKDTLIVSSSGDGGYHEVINGALRAQAEGAAPICAVLPAGNANDHARTMQAKKPLHELIIAGNITKIDVLKLQAKSPGEQTEIFAHSYIGLGLTPTVAAELNKYSLDSLREALIVIRTFWKTRPIRLKIQGRVYKYDSLICSTIPEMAKFLTLSKNAKPDDGKLEINTLPHASKLSLLYKLLRGTFASMNARSRKRKLVFETMAKIPLQMDGEIHYLPKNTHVTIAIEHQLLRTII